MKYLLGKKFKVYPGHGKEYRDNYDEIDWSDAPPVPKRSQHIVRNAVRCLLCNDVIESHYRHDFVACQCGSVCVDGGTSYLKRSGEPDKYEDLSEYEDD